MDSGKLIIFSAPSGAGKTTIVKHLLKTFPEHLAFSVSATSRECREGEVHGKDYYFLTKEDFKERIANDEFVEWEEVYSGSLYGTLREEIGRIWKDGKCVVFDVDVEGGLNLKDQFKEDALAVFVLPPSLKILEERLTSRNTESPESLARRISKAEQELATAKHFDMMVINEKLENAFIQAEKLVKNFLKLH